MLSQGFRSIYTDKKSEVTATDSTMETNNPGKAKQARVSLLASLSWDEIQQRARLEADGAASASVIAQLESDPVRWRNVLTDMIEEAEDTLQSVRRIKGPHRNQIMTDFESEFSLLTEAVSYTHLRAHET